MPKTFADYADDGASWITLASGEFYPDILSEACELYKPVLVTFGNLLKRSATSTALFESISDVNETWMRVQLARVFKKYVSPGTPVEMLKRKRKTAELVEQFSSSFRTVAQVQKAFNTRPLPDEALCALLWEYKDRGKKGYDLTEKFFVLARKQLKGVEIRGPQRAGRDILLGDVWADYPNRTRPVDFVISRGNDVLAIGLARYDGDRGGAQEDDRTGGYRDCATEILGYARRKRFEKLKVIFLNDGPGLLLGSMWSDYAKLEAKGNGRILVTTLRMLPERLTLKWLEG